MGEEGLAKIVKSLIKFAYDLHVGIYIVVQNWDSKLGKEGQILRHGHGCYRPYALNIERQKIISDQIWQIERGSGGQI